MAAVTATGTMRRSPKTTPWRRKCSRITVMGMGMPMTTGMDMGTITPTIMGTIMATITRTITATITLMRLLLRKTVWRQSGNLLANRSASPCAAPVVATFTVRIADTIMASSELPMAPTELIALLHLASPALPIGGFSYSQGLEAAVEAGIVTDGQSAQTWIGDGLNNVLARCELPFIAQQMRRWQALAQCRTQGNAAPTLGDMAAEKDGQTVADANAWYLASRESAELLQETEQMGWSLASLAASLGWGHDDDRALLMTLKPLALPTAFAFVAVAHNAGIQATLSAYAFNWVENQVAAALKSVPLGQLAGQRVLWHLREAIAAAATHASTIAPSGLSTFSPLLGILSSRHESQYSRLFRS